jgi:hypothetical protein
MMTWDDYKDIGFLHGAIGNRAEGVYQKLYQALGTKAESALSQLLWDLTIAQKSAASTYQVVDYGFTSQPIFLEDYPKESVERKLIEAFSNKEVRLFILDGGADKPTQVRVTHEALLTHWSSAQKILQELKEYIALRERVKQDFYRWHTAGKPADLLLPVGKRLAESEDLLENRQDRLLSTKGGEELIAYIKASSQAEQARKVRKLIVYGTGLFFILIIIAMGFYSTYDKGQIALAGQLFAEAEQNLFKKDYARAEIAAAKSLTIKDDVETRDLLFKAQAGGISLISNALQKMPHATLSQFSRDGQLIASRDVQLLNLNQRLKL